MAKSKPLTPANPTGPPGHSLVACAVRTLEAEAGGIAALIEAIGNGLGGDLRRRGRPDPRARAAG